jgi:hypothetical protein
MCPPWAAPPAADSCLSRFYSSRPNQKGGTIIDESVLDLGTHLRKLVFVDQCRPKLCRCGSSRLHVHQVRERRPRQLFFEGQPVPTVPIAIFLCAACDATWRVLPAFLARCLWRTWDVVERESLGNPRPPQVPPVPTSTVRRWRSRLAQSARLLLQVLAVAGGELRKLTEHVPADAGRLDLVLAYGRGFAALAVLLHRLAPGVRLM